jgi:hypothetical protein
MFSGHIEDFPVDSEVGYPVNTRFVHHQATQIPSHTNLRPIGRMAAPVTAAAMANENPQIPWASMDEVGIIKVEPEEGGDHEMRPISRHILWWADRDWVQVSQNSYGLVDRVPT